MEPQGEGTAGANPERWAGWKHWEEEVSVASREMGTGVVRLWRHHLGRVLCAALRRSRFTLRGLGSPRKLKT